MADVVNIGRVLVVAFTCVISGVQAASDVFPKHTDKLMLTPLISAGEVGVAQSLSRVHAPSIYNGSSYAGYITADEALGNHLFFWFFPSMTDPKAPVLIWLNGGPGVSSLQGLFQENGPVQVDLDEYERSGHVRLVPRSSSWVGPFSMLYIDNPVGVGFSFSDSGVDGYRTTREGYSQDLYSFLQQFYGLFPSLLQNDLYIGGQSYAGKYVTAFANKVHEGKSESIVNIPLRGIYIGGPFIYPEVQGYAQFEFAKTLGFISDADYLRQRKQIKKMFTKFKDGEEIDYQTIVKTIFYNPVPPNNFVNTHNFVTEEYLYQDFFYDNSFTSQLRAAVHVGYSIFEIRSRHYFYLLAKEDFLMSTESMMTTLLNNYSVLIFNGDFDLIVNSASVEAALVATPWDGQVEYCNASRLPWKVGQDLGGFYTRTGGLCRVVVHGAGHQVATDQPLAARDMMVQWLDHGCVR